MTEDNKDNALAGLDRPLRLGTRQSPLALAQAKLAAKRILKTHGWRDDQVELVPVIATGDKILDRPLAEVGGKALWTKELDRALANKEIDCAVHSMKDVETLRPETFTIAAILERAPVHDRLVGAQSVEELKNGAVVGTASPRRKAQLLRTRSDLEIRLIRGNVQTRLQKIAEGEYDATLLAAAGLKRLDLDDVGHDIPIDVMLPAPAQAAIGIEARADDQHVRRLLREISDIASYRAVIAERQFLEALGADCHSPIAALTSVDGLELFLQAEILMPDGSEHVEGESQFQLGDVDAPRNLAKRLLGQASDTLRAAFGK